MHVDVAGSAGHAWHHSFSPAAAEEPRARSVSPMAPSPSYRSPSRPSNATSAGRPMSPSAPLVSPSMVDLPEHAPRSRLPSLAQGFGFGFADPNASPGRAGSRLPSSGPSVGGPRPSIPSLAPSLTRTGGYESSLSPRSSFSGPSGAARLPPLSSLPSRRKSLYDEAPAGRPRLPSLTHSGRPAPLPLLPSSAEKEACDWNPSIAPTLHQRRETHATLFPVHRLAYGRPYVRSSLSGPSPGSSCEPVHGHDAPTSFSPAPHKSLPSSPVPGRPPAHDARSYTPGTSWQASGQHGDPFAPHAQGEHGPPTYTTSGPGDVPPRQEYPPPSVAGWVSSYPALPSGAMPSPAGPPPPRSTPAPPPASARERGAPRPFKCTSCGAAFARNHDLRRHARIHLTTKPFACPKCNKPFSRKDALNRHVLVKGGNAACSASSAKRSSGSRAGPPCSPSSQPDRKRGRLSPSSVTPAQVAPGKVDE